MNPQSKQVAHTPGPLAWQKFGDEWCLTGQYGMRPIVLSVGGRPRKLQLRDGSRDLLVPFDPNHPDARLLAAAPELLAACQGAHQMFCDAMFIWGRDDDKKVGHMTKAIYQAIAKATGGKV